MHPLATYPQLANGDESPSGRAFNDVDRACDEYLRRKGLIIDWQKLHQAEAKEAGRKNQRKTK